MHDPQTAIWTLDIIWWITVVEMPALAALFWLNWRLNRDIDEAIADARHESETGLTFLRESLAAYKLEVAQSYASITYLKEVEHRLTGHLIRIENKLDGQSGSGAGDKP